MTSEKYLCLLNNNDINLTRADLDLLRAIQNGYATCPATNHSNDLPVIPCRLSLTCLNYYLPNSTSSTPDMLLKTLGTILLK